MWWMEIVPLFRHVARREYPAIAYRRVHDPSLARRASPPLALSKGSLMDTMGWEEAVDVFRRLRFEGALVVEFVDDNLVSNEAVDIRHAAETRYRLRVHRKLAEFHTSGREVSPLFSSPILTKAFEPGLARSRSLMRHVILDGCQETTAPPLCWAYRCSGRSLWQVIQSSNSMLVSASLDDTKLDFSFDRCLCWRPLLFHTNRLFDMNSPCGSTNLKCVSRYETKTSHVP